MKLPADIDSLIETERLVLEPMLGKHAVEMFPLLVDPALYEFTGGDPPASELDLADLYEFREGRRSPDGAELWLNWLVREQGSKVALGFVQATIAAEHSSVAWVVGTRWQGRGFASEAAAGLVNWLKLRAAPRAIACVHPEHVASQRVAHHSGLRRTDRQIDGEEVWT